MVTNRKELWEAGKYRAEENVGALDKNTEIWSDVFKLTAVLATAMETSELEYFPFSGYVSSRDVS